MVRFRFAGRPFAVILVICGTVLQSRAEVKFLRAQHESASGTVLFDWPNDIDWERLARKHTPWAFANTLSSDRLDQIEKAYCEPCASSDVPFDAPLDATIGDGFHRYLITPQGIEPLVVTHFEGRVRFDKGKDGWWKRDRVFGKVAATFASGTTPKNGGFVLVAPEDMSPRLIPSARFVATRNGQQLQCAYQKDDLHYKLTLPFEGASAVESTLSFHVGEQEFCWVQWKPDRGCEYACCEEQYSLFSTDGELKLLDTQLYNCDL